MVYRGDGIAGEFSRSIIEGKMNPITEVLPFVTSIELGKAVGLLMKMAPKKEVCEEKPQSSAYAESMAATLLRLNSCQRGE